MLMGLKKRQFANQKGDSFFCS